MDTLVLTTLLIDSAGLTLLALGWAVASCLPGRQRSRRA